MDGKLADVPEGVLICDGRIQAEDFRSRVLHEIDRRKRMGARRFGGAYESQVSPLRHRHRKTPWLFQTTYLENAVQDGLISRRSELPDRKERSNPNAIFGGRPELQAFLGRVRKMHTTF
jgi:hypothetical protein